MSLFDIGDGSLKTMILRSYMIIDIVMVIDIII